MVMNIERPLGLRDWIITLILTFIPIVNLVMLVTWAFDKENPRKNFARAYMIVVGSVLLISLPILLVMFVFSYSSTSTEEYDSNYYSDFEHYEYSSRADDLEITELVFTENPYNFRMDLSGEIRNLSQDFTFEEIILTGFVYDESGAIIDNFRLFFTQVIPPGETYKFEEKGFHKDAYSIKIKQITHYPE